MYSIKLPTNKKGYGIDFLNCNNRKLLVRKISKLRNVLHLILSVSDDRIECKNSNFGKLLISSISSGLNQRIGYVFKGLEGEQLHQASSSMGVQYQETGKDFVYQTHKLGCFFFSRRMLGLMLFYRCLMSSQIS